MNLHNKKIIILAVAASLLVIPGYLYAAGYTNGFIPPPPPPAVSGSIPVANSTAQAFEKIPNWGKTFVFEKHPNADLQITAKISNAIKFTGTITSPSGVIHNLNPVLNNTQTELQYYVQTSDPAGNYIVAFNVINGSNTSNVNVDVQNFNNDFGGPTFPALQAPPPTK